MLSIIISTFNEEEGIAKTICSIPKDIRKNAELIVVDVSNDYTPIIAKELGAMVLKEKRLGKGWQMRQAVQKSKGDILVFMDGDGTDPGQYIPAMLKKLKKANLVLGCRSSRKFNSHKSKSYPWQSYIIWDIIFYPTNQILGLNVSDPLAGFRAIRRKDFDVLDLKSNDFTIETEMNIKSVKKNFIVKQVFIPSLKRSGGLANSKFLKNPGAWFKIYKMISDYNKEKNQEIKKVKI